MEFDKAPEFGLGKNIRRPVGIDEFTDFQDLMDPVVEVHVEVLW